MVTRERPINLPGELDLEPRGKEGILCAHELIELKQETMSKGQDLVVYSRFSGV